MSNQAAWMTVANGRPLTVDSAEAWKPGPNEVLVENAAVAINPIDWKMQDLELYGKFLSQYPNILGVDIAGEIVEVGSDVARFSKGQRVLAHCVGLDTSEPKHGAFQKYTVVSEYLASPIPDSLPFDKATVLPLSISTSAAALYMKAHLGLPYPSKSPEATGKTILITGGSSSVGSAAIQLAVASGLTVATTSSAHNTNYVKSIGATYVFDYSKRTLVDDIVSSLSGCSFVGVFDVISLPNTIKCSVEVAKKLGNPRLVTSCPPPADLTGDVKASGVISLDILYKEREVSEAVWTNWMPGALEDGQLQAKPDPIVLEGGLLKIQDAVDRLRRGVSAAKVVVHL